MKKRNSQTKTFIPYMEYIHQLACATNEIHITTRNRKTGPLVNDLAFPICCCRSDAPCKLKGVCYCLKGTQQMSTVLAAYYRNLRLYNENPEDFWEQVKFKIKYNPCPKFRFFDAGDLPRKEFVKETYDLVLKFPNISFLMFTKHYDWVNETIKEFGYPPENLTIRFSAWDKNWNVENPYNLPIAYVDFKDSNLNPVFPSNCVGCLNQKDKLMTCSACGLCWNKNLTIKFLQH